jgi:hypothetical protein
MKKKALIFILLALLGFSVFFLVNILSTPTVSY